MTALEELPAPVVQVCRALLAGLQGILGENLVGVYLYGAMTFPDSRDAIADIDYHVILRRTLDDANRLAVAQFLRSLGRDYPPLGGELDGYYVTLEDARRTSRAPTQMHPLWTLPVDEAWSLHCAHIRAGRVTTLFGPDPMTIYPEPSWQELEEALWQELRFVEEHLEDAPAFGILNACRILYSMRTHDVVISKRGAAAWGLSNLPERRHSTIRTALHRYGEPRSDAALEMLRVSAQQFVAYVNEELRAS